MSSKYVLCQPNSCNFINIAGMIQWKEEGIGQKCEVPVYHTKISKCVVIILCQLIWKIVKLYISREVKTYKLIFNKMKDNSNIVANEFEQKSLVLKLLGIPVMYNLYFHFHTFCKLGSKSKNWNTQIFSFCG